VSGRIALVGSGEFTPATEAVDTALLNGRHHSVVFLPTAAAPEGEERLAYWVELGLTHYARMGVAATPLLVLDRAHAESADLAAQIAGAGLVYLSGGNPAYLATTLVGSRVGAAIHDAWLEGAAVAGCSAGAIALMESVPNIRDRSGPGVPGLGLVQGMSVIPHFDQLERWLPGATRWAVNSTPPATQLIGIDEDTAIVGEALHWTVMGRGAAWVLRALDGPVRYADGDVLALV
jgi:cyanophycinase